MSISRIVFDIACPPSVVHVTRTTTKVFLDKNNSLHDVRMGAFKNMKCGTCNQGETTCPGHFGHIELVLPVLNPYFMAKLLRKVLKEVCYVCKRVKCTCKKRVRGKTVAKPTRVTISRNGAYDMHNKGTKFSFFQSSNKLTLEKLHEFISKIPVEETELIFPQFKGRRIEDLVFIKNLPVMPHIARPPCFNKGGWMPNTITMMYSEIIKNNNDVKYHKNVGVHAYLIEEAHNTLQNSVNVLFDTSNTTKNCTGYMYSNGGIKNRIDSKEGRIRSNLMGKRTNFSARTVLSGDPNLGINQIGVPPSIARNLTVPEYITRYNINSINMRKVRYIVKNGERYDTAVCTSIKPTIGDIVERELMDGDVVAINRQPTLHRGSMMACKVKIIPCSTFRLNYSTMIPLNADCDGDEINIFVPQDQASRAELEQLLMVSQSVVNSQSSKPVIALSQDSLLGCFLLSVTLIDYITWNDIIMHIDIDDTGIHPAVLKPKPLYSGRQVIEAILHQIVGWDDWVDRYPEKAFDKGVLGTGANSLIHTVYLRFGGEKAAQLIHKLQIAANCFLTTNGFSVGIGDCLDTGDNFNWDALDGVLNKEKKNSNEKELIDAYQNILFMKEDSKDNIHNNNLVAMMKAGSKGSIINYNQIKRCVGQQVDNGGRIGYELNKNKRTLPHFIDNDNSGMARGHVKNSFIKGLTPQEFFFHAKTSRNSLIDTACKTSVTGYLQRQMVKNVEAIVVGYDGTVRNNINGQVIQFKYGGDGLDQTYKTFM